MSYVVGLSGCVAHNCVQCVRIAINGVCLAGDCVIQFIVRGLQGGDLIPECIHWRRGSTGTDHAFHDRSSVNRTCDQNAQNAYDYVPN